MLTRCSIRLVLIAFTVGSGSTACDADKHVDDAAAKVKAELARRDATKAKDEASAPRPAKAEAAVATAAAPHVEAGATKPGSAKPKQEAKLIYAELSDLLAIGTGELTELRERIDDHTDLAAANRCGAVMHGMGTAGGTVERAKAVRERADLLPRDAYFDLRVAAINIQFCVTCASWGDESCGQTKSDLREAKKSLR